MIATDALYRSATMLRLGEEQKEALI